MEKQVTVHQYMQEIDDAGKVAMSLQDFMNRAEEAVRRRNYDYAVAMYRRVLAEQPENLWVRRRLRGTELKRDQEGDARNPILGAIAGVPSIIKLVFAALFGKHAAVMNAAEAFLVRAPTNVWVLRQLAHSAHRLGLLQTAIFSLENAAGEVTKNVRVLVDLGTLYRETKQINKAVECFNIASSLRPHDRELARRAEGAQADQTIEKSQGLEKGDYRQSLADAEEAETLDRTDRVERDESDADRLVRRYKTDVDASPDDLGPVRRLAEAYRQNEDWDNAYTWYLRASEIEPNEFALKVQMGEMRRAKYRLIIRQAEAAVREKPDDAAAKQRLTDVRREAAEFDLAEFQRRVAAYPSDLSLKYELGVRLFHRGDIPGAVRQFQMSVREPKRGRESRIYLGRCFLAQHLPELAKEQFSRAIEGKEVLDDEQALTIYYHLAEAQEALGDFAGAVENYGKIYGVDVTFRDVQERMDRARQKAKAPRPGLPG